jgi:tetratricopeptide (TPR) repeat protein
VAAPAAPQVSFGNYVGTLFADGKMLQAESVYGEWQRRLPPSSLSISFPALFMYSRGQLDSAETYWRGRMTDPNLSTRISAIANLSSFALLHGRLREADSLARSARTMSAAMRGVPVNPFNDSVSKASGVIWFLNENERGVRMLDAVLLRTPLRTLPDEPSAYLNVATAYALAGRPDKARAVMTQYDHEVHDARFRTLAEPAWHQVLGEIALAEKRPLDAVREFWRSDSLSDGPDGDCYFCKDVLLGRAYDLANMPDSAIAHFERYLGAKYPGRLGIDDQNLPAVYKRLGELYDARGDTQRAASHYMAFINLWKNADPELQPRVKDTKDRLARLPGVAGR